MFLTVNSRECYEVSSQTFEMQNVNNDDKNNNSVFTRGIPSANRNTNYQIEIKSQPYKRALIFHVFVF